jgi:hypothetical protein
MSRLEKTNIVSRWILSGSLLVEFAACLVAIAFAGGGHGTYHAAKCLFPYTMISTGFFGVITLPFIVVACLQYLTYGVILLAANLKGKLRPIAIALLLVHLAATGLAFAISSNAFCP